MRADFFEIRVIGDEVSPQVFNLLYDLFRLLGYLLIAQSLEDGLQIREE